MEKEKTDMLQPHTTFDPASIRNYHFVKNGDGMVCVQFIAIGDRHRMMKDDDGSIKIIREPEQGKPYRLGMPLDIESALSVLAEKTYPTHEEIAKHITKNINKQATNAL